MGGSRKELWKGGQEPWEGQGKEPLEGQATLGRGRKILEGVGNLQEEEEASGRSSSLWKGKEAFGKGGKEPLEGAGSFWKGWEAFRRGRKFLEGAVAFGRAGKSLWKEQ